MFTKQNGVWSAVNEFLKNGGVFKEGPHHAKENGVYIPTSESKEPILTLALARSIAEGNTLSDLTQSLNYYRLTIVRNGVETDLDSSTGTLAISTPSDSDSFLRFYKKPSQPPIVDTIQISFNNNALITEIVSFGNNWRNNCYPSVRSMVLTKVPDYLPESINLVSNAFNSCSEFNQDLRSWDMKNIEYAGAVFMFATKYNQPITWVAPKLKMLNLAFTGCSGFNKPVNIDAPELVLANDMFSQCTTFNSPVTITGSKIENTANMFYLCFAFDQPVTIDTSNVTDMSSMFIYCYAFNKSLAHFDVSKCTNFSGMLQNTIALKQSIANWQVTGSPLKTDFATNSGLTASQIPLALR